MNKTIITFLIAILCFNSADLFSKISVIIPCHSSHSYLLPGLLENLEYQTRKPDEVVISISEMTKRDVKLLKESFHNSTFEIKILSTKKIQYAGQNRNIAAKIVTGDLVITQDADDIPHPQRLEIIEYFFMKTKACHMMHQWYPSDVNKLPPNSDGPEWKDYYEDFDSIPVVEVKNVHDLFLRSNFLTNGCIAISKTVLDVVSWSNKKIREDIEFNINVINKFHNTLIIVAPLYIYRNELSSRRSILQ